MATGRAASTATCDNRQVCVGHDLRARGHLTVHSSCRQHLLLESKTPCQGVHCLHLQRPPTPVTNGDFCHRGCEAQHNWCGTKTEERRAAGGSPHPAGPVCEPRQFLSYSLRAETVFDILGKIGGPVRRRTHQKSKAQGMALGNSPHLFVKIKWGCEHPPSVAIVGIKGPRVCAVPSNQA